MPADRVGSEDRKTLAHAAFDADIDLAGGADGDVPCMLPISLRSVGSFNQSGSGARREATVVPPT